jgi:hypothetical protein
VGSPVDLVIHLDKRCLILVVALSLNLRFRNKFDDEDEEEDEDHAQRENHNIRTRRKKCRAEPRESPESPSPHQNSSNTTGSDTKPKGFAALENHFVREKKVKTALENGSARELGEKSFTETVRRAKKMKIQNGKPFGTGTS